MKDKYYIRNDAFVKAVPITEPLGYPFSEADYKIGDYVAVRSHLLGIRNVIIIDKETFESSYIEATIK